jgi:lysophospholipase L1-like esterase
MKKKELELAAIKNYLAPYLNLHKVHPFLPGALTLKGQAAFIGMDESELKELRQSYEKVAKSAAMELLKDDMVSDDVHQLPFSPDSRIMVIGDSTADDMQGWFEILRHTLNVAVDDAEFTFINAAVYNSTSLDVLRRLDRDLSIYKPDWVFVSVGSHDAQKLHAFADNRTLVSLAEFWENVAVIESMIGEVTPNPIIWVTPPSVITELMQDMPLFSGIIAESELSGYRELIAGKSGYVVDPYGTRMGNPVNAWNYLSDGFHASLSGHMETVKAILRSLSKQEE